MSDSDKSKHKSEAEYCAELKEHTKALYDSTKSIKVPYFKGEEVTFNSDGFHHFRYNTSGSERRKSNQIRRYKSFPLAPYVLKRAGTVQQHRRTFKPIGRRKGDGFRKTAIVEEWCFIDLIKSLPGKDTCVKVVVRRVGDGPLHFYSVMPFKAPDYLAHADPDT